MASDILLIDHHRTGEDLGSLCSTSSHFHSIALFAKAWVGVPHGNTSQALNNWWKREYQLYSQQAWNKPSGLVWSKVIDLLNIKAMRHDIQFLPRPTSTPLKAEWWVLHSLGIMVVCFSFSSKVQLTITGNWKDGMKYKLPCWDVGGFKAKCTHGPDLV